MYNYNEEDIAKLAYIKEDPKNRYHRPLSERNLLNGRFNSHIEKKTRLELLSIFENIYIDNACLSKLILVNLENKYYVCLEYVLNAFRLDTELNELFPFYMDFRNLDCSINMVDSYFNKLGKFYGIKHASSKRIYKDIEAEGIQCRMNLYEIPEQLAMLIAKQPDITKVKEYRSWNGEMVFFRSNYKLIEHNIRRSQSLERKDEALESLNYKIQFRSILHMITQACKRYRLC